MKLKNIIVAILTFFSGVYALGQETIDVKNVPGSWIVANITPEAAKEQAINEAKKEALKRAGIKEVVMNSDILSTKQSNGDFAQIFENISAVDIQGEVLEYELISENVKKDEFNNMVSQVVINAKVIKYDKSADASFRIRVEGVETMYKSGQKLKFSVMTYANGYLKIFNLCPAGNLMLYPYIDSKNPALSDKAGVLFEANKAITFPINPNLDLYELFTESDQEPNSLVFVYTKKNIPYTKSGFSEKEILSWIYSIMPDERTVSFERFFIVK